MTTPVIDEDRFAELDRLIFLGWADTPQDKIPREVLAGEMRFRVSAPDRSEILRREHNGRNTAFRARKEGQQWRVGWPFYPGKPQARTNRQATSGGTPAEKTFTPRKTGLPRVFCPPSLPNLSIPGL